MSADKVAFINAADLKELTQGIREENDAMPEFERTFLLKLQLLHLLICTGKVTYADAVIKSGELVELYCKQHAPKEYDAMQRIAATIEKRMSDVKEQ